MGMVGSLLNCLRASTKVIQEWVIDVLEVLIQRHPSRGRKHDVFTEFLKFLLWQPKTGLMRDLP